jgi:hypothetical protein
MVTVIEPSNERVERTTIERTSDSGGWAVAVIVLLVALAVGAYAWVHYRRAATPASGGTNINVTLPTPGANSGNTNSGNPGGTPAQ